MAQPPIQTEVDDGPAPARGRLRAVLATVVPAAVLISLVGLVYFQSLRGTFIWDDEDHVRANAALRDWGGLRQIWTQVGAAGQYHPLVDTSFWFEWHVWRDYPGRYRAINVGLHALSAVVLWLILRRLRLPGVFLAAGIWALHPLQVESVVWISQRKTVLGGLLYLLAMGAYLRFEEARDLRTEVSNLKSKIAWYAIAFLLFITALLSNAVTATLPAILVIILWWQRGRLNGRAIWPTLPFFTVAVPMGALALWTERAVVGAAGPEWDIGVIERLGVAGRAVWSYVGQLIFPARLCINYDRWDPADLLPGLLGAVAILVGLIVLCRRRERIGRGPLAAVLLFVGTLVPVLGFANFASMRYAFVADHFQYLAGISAIVLIVGVLSRLGVGARIVLFAIMLLLSLRASEYTRIFENQQTVWAHTLKRNPASRAAHNQLGFLAREAGDFRAAEGHFRSGLKAWPANDEAMVHLANFAIAGHRNDEAEDLLRRSMELRLASWPGSYRYASASEPSRILAMMLADQGRLDEAVRIAAIARDANPADQSAARTYGNLIARQGTR